MEMTLRLPSSYVSIERDEMEYVDGGISVSSKWWGIQMTFSGRETTALLIAIGVGSAASWLAAECLAIGITTLPASIPFGVIGAALCLSATLIVAANYKNNGNGFSINRFWAGVTTIW